MTKIQDLRQLAHTIKTETNVGGNTADRVGSAFEGVADALEGTEQIAEMDKAVQEVQQQVEASKAQIQSLVNALPVVQQTGDSTTSVMSQKAVTDALSTSDIRISAIENLSEGVIEKIYGIPQLTIDGYGVNANNGTLVAYEGWWASEFLNVYDRLELRTNNSATSFGLAFYSGKSEDSFISGIIYKNQNGLQEVPVGAKYIRFGLPYNKGHNNYYQIEIKTYQSVAQETSLIVKTVNGIKGNFIRNSIKILGIGNSFTRDAVSYVPYLLRELFPNIHIVIGIIYGGGYSLSDHMNAMTNDRNMTYDKYDYDTNRWTMQNATEKAIIQDEDWDIITLQQNSNNSNNYSTYQPFAGQLIKNIFNYAKSSVKICWLMTHVKPVENRDIFFENMVAAIKKVYEEEPIEYIFPCGLAIENARKTPLDGLGDYHEGGHLIYSDGQHLQEGIPCLIEAYTFTLGVLKLIGKSYKSVFGSTLRVSDEWGVRNNIPERNGSCVGVDDEQNYMIAQKCAIMASKANL